MKKSIKIVLILFLILNIFTTNKVSANELTQISKIEENIECLVADKTGNPNKIEYDWSNKAEWPTKEKDSTDEESKTEESEEIDYKNYNPTQTGSSTKVQTMAGKVLAIVRNIGVVVSIIALTIIGIKYMFGSVEQKADYKKTMIPFVIGIIMLVAGTTLVTFIYETITKDQQSTGNSSSSGGGPEKGITIFESMLN